VTRTLPIPKSTGVSDRLALNLLDAGIAPLDRVVCSCRTSPSSFFLLRAAKDRLRPHCRAQPRTASRGGPVREALGCRACVTPTVMVTSTSGRWSVGCATRRHQSGWESCSASAGVPLSGRPDLPRAEETPEDLRALKIDPTDPAIFQLSGNHGRAQLIPRTHNDSATFAAILEVVGVVVVGARNSLGTPVVPPGAGNRGSVGSILSARRSIRPFLRLAEIRSAREENPAGARRARFPA